MQILMTSLQEGTVCIDLVTVHRTEHRTIKQNGKLCITRRETLRWYHVM